MAEATIPPIPPVMLADLDAPDPPPPPNVIAEIVTFVFPFGPEAAGLEFNHQLVQVHLTPSVQLSEGGNYETLGNFRKEFVRFCLSVFQFCVDGEDVQEGLMRTRYEIRSFSQFMVRELAIVAAFFAGDPSPDMFMYNAQAYYFFLTQMATWAVYYSHAMFNHLIVDQQLDFSFAYNFIDSLFRGISPFHGVGLLESDSDEEQMQPNQVEEGYVENVENDMQMGPDQAELDNVHNQEVEAEIHEVEENMNIDLGQIQQNNAEAEDNVDEIVIEPPIEVVQIHGNRPFKCYGPCQRVDTSVLSGGCNNCGHWYTLELCPTKFYPEVVKEDNLKVIHEFVLCELFSNVPHLEHARNVARLQGEAEEKEAQVQQILHFWEGNVREINLLARDASMEPFMVLLPEAEEMLEHQLCPICYEAKGGDLREVRQLLCQHSLHTDCLKLHLSYRTNSCPMCRAAIPIVPL